MAKYVLAYYGGGAAAPEEQEAVMQAWGAWFAELGPAVADSGAPFSGQANTVRPDGSTSSGGIAQELSGYSIVQADSLDHATQMARACPLLSANGSIVVYETHEM